MLGVITDCRSSPNAFATDFFGMQNFEDQFRQEEPRKPAGRCLLIGKWGSGIQVWDWVCPVSGRPLKEEFCWVS